MSSYPGTANRPDRAKAIGAVVAVHAALAAIILTGLNVQIVRHAVERLQTFDLRDPPPPPPNPPPAAPKPSRARLEAGAPTRRAKASPVVAPQPRLPLPSPIVASRVAGVGDAPASGAAMSGTGTGAGDIGSGPGGGGAADYSRFRPARLVRNLNRADYRQLAAGRLPSGRATVSLRIDADGAPGNCRIVRSSGDAVVDGGLCPLIVNRLGFRPALNDHGRPIAYQLQYIATWAL